MDPAQTTNRHRTDTSVLHDATSEWGLAGNHGPPCNVGVSFKALQVGSKGQVVSSLGERLSSYTQRIEYIFIHMQVTRLGIHL